MQKQYRKFVLVVFAVVFLITCTTYLSKDILKSIFHLEESTGNSIAQKDNDDLLSSLRLDAEKNIEQINNDINRIPVIDSDENKKNDLLSKIENSVIDKGQIENQLLENLENDKDTDFKSYDRKRSYKETKNFNKHYNTINNNEKQTNIRQYKNKLSLDNEQNKKSDFNDYKLESVNTSKKSLTNFESNKSNPDYTNYKSQQQINNTNLSIKNSQDYLNSISQTESHKNNKSSSYNTEENKNNTTEKEETASITAIDQFLSVTGNKKLPIVFSSYGTSQSSVKYAITNFPKNGKIYGDPPDIKYVANEGYYGTDTISYIAITNGKPSNISNITIEVAQNYLKEYSPRRKSRSGQTIPQICEQSNTITTTSTVTLNEDLCVDIALSITGASGYAIYDLPDNGNLTGTPPNLKYSPFEDFYGQDTFSFYSIDGTTISGPYTATFGITNVNDYPVP